MSLVVRVHPDFVRSIELAEHWRARQVTRPTQELLAEVRPSVPGLLDHTVVLIFANDPREKGDYRHTRLFSHDPGTPPALTEGAAKWMWENDVVYRLLDLAWECPERPTDRQADLRATAIQFKRPQEAFAFRMRWT